MSTIQRWCSLTCLLLLFVLSGQAESAEPLVSGWKVGPSTQLGFPHPLQLSIEGRSLNYDFSEGISGGYLGLKFPVGQDGTKVSVYMGNLEAKWRWHPFSGAFFMGLGLGRQWVGASTTKTIVLDSSTSVGLHLQAKVNNAYATPHLGWLWSYKSGLFLGVELGIQYGFAASSSSDISMADPLQNSLLGLVKQTQAYRDLEANVSEGLDKVGKIHIPYLTLFRVGWFF